MMASLECSAGQMGKGYIGKLEDEVWIMAEGPVVLLVFPNKENLMQ